MYKVQIAPGVGIMVNTLELKILKYLKKSGNLPYKNLNSDVKCAINKLLSKGLVIRSKKGDYVSIQIHGKAILPKN
jgi:hypothetical protein